MTRNSQPPFGDEEQAALGLFAELTELSTQILTLKTPADLPRLNQLILTRGKILDQLGGIPLNKLSDETKNQLVLHMAQIAMCEDEINRNLGTMRDEVDGQLQQIRGGKKLIEKYKIDLGGDSDVTRERDA